MTNVAFAAFSLITKNDERNLLLRTTTKNLPYKIVATPPKRPIPSASSRGRIEQFHARKLARKEQLSPTFNSKRRD
jgi:hypothetical protein